MGCYVTSYYLRQCTEGNKAMQLSKMDYQYYGCHIKNYVFSEEKKTLVLYCNYLGRAYVTLILRDVLAYDSLEFLSNHVINHIIRSYDIETDTNLFEIHFSHLFEVTKVWAKTMLPTSSPVDSTQPLQFF